VNELLRQAERTLAMGRLDEAEGLFQRALDQDPRSAIAALGLARVAGERGDEAGAYRLAGRAVRLDPANGAAIALLVRLREILAGRGEQVELPPALRGRDRAPSSGKGSNGSRPGLLRRLLGRRGG
jgi:tetratricopeptide (TPR) repeat protein